MAELQAAPWARMGVVGIWRSVTWGSEGKWRSCRRNLGRGREIAELEGESWSRKVSVGIWLSFGGDSVTGRRMSDLELRSSH
jgi:hypothetical protein